MFRPSTGPLHTTALPYTSNPKTSPQLPKPSRSHSFTHFDDTPLSLTFALPSSPAISPNNAPRRPMTTSTTTNMFPSFLDNPSTTTPTPTPRSAPPQPNGGMNGTANGVGASNGAAGMGPMSAGQQVDVNFLWGKVLELSEVLRENRERTRGVVEGAESLAARAGNTHPAQPDAHDLRHDLHAAHTTITTLHRESRENARLIGDYEAALGSIVEMVRNAAYAQSTAATTLASHYNRLLQEEKDAHLEARLEAGEWRERYGRVVEMLREGYRRSCEEEGGVVGVVRGLQEEVRALRKVVGLEAEGREEEGGWSVLRGEGGEGDGEGEG